MVEKKVLTVRDLSMLVRADHDESLLSATLTPTRRVWNSRDTCNSRRTEKLRQREKLVDMGNVRYFKLCRSKVAVIGLACEAVKLSQVSCHAEVERLRILTSGLRSYLWLSHMLVSR